MLQGIRGRIRAATFRELRFRMEMSDKLVSLELYRESNVLFDSTRSSSCLIFRTRVFSLFFCRGEEIDSY